MSRKFQMETTVDRRRSIFIKEGKLLKVLTTKHEENHGIRKTKLDINKPVCSI